jgi:hypothetical protein
MIAPKTLHADIMNFIVQTDLTTLSQLHRSDRENRDISVGIATRLWARRSGF